MFCLRYLTLNRETKVKAVNTTALYAQHPLVLRFRAFCVFISANQLQLRSTLEDLITADPFSWRLVSSLPPKGGERDQRRRWKKKLNKRKEEGGRERERTGGTIVFRLPQDLVSLLSPSVSFSLFLAFSPMILQAYVAFLSACNARLSGFFPLR